MKRFIKIVALIVVWAAGAPAWAIPLGVRIALWSIVAAQGQSGNTMSVALDAAGLKFTTGGDAEWTVQGETMHGGGAALKSGTIGDSQETWVETSVNGAGVLSFWWKASSEHYRQYAIDYAMFSVDGQERLRIGGEQDWTNAVVTLEGTGTHILRWTYVKDSEVSGGEDCAWLDEVTWTPTGGFPEVVDNSEVAMALIDTADETMLVAHITTKSEYDVFRSWVDNNSLFHGLVKDAPNAWLSYALDAPGLMAKATALASEDVVIESIESSSTVSGALELVVSIADAEIGEDARLAEVLGVEGAAELSKSAFSFDGLSVTLERTTDGKAKATVTPDGAPPAFFLRVKVK